MADYILSERARKDIKGIGDYTQETWSEEQAENYVRMLLYECRLLASNPMIGRSYDECRPGLRGYLCGRHIIFYRILPQHGVRIVRVLHVKMDFPRHL